MKYFLQVAAGIDPLPLLAELQRQPHLWDEHTERTDGDSPHAEASDIWLRFRVYNELTAPEAFQEPFIPVNYPAWSALPSVRPIVFSLMARLQAVQLGGVLLTRVPPGRSVKPHHDRGRWHAEFFNTKVVVPLMTNDLCSNTAPGERLIMRAGEAWIFENQVVHATINDGGTDRVSLIVALRCES